MVRITSSAGTGTGVIYDTQGRTGYVITNEHVVEGQSRVNVTVGDSTSYRGTVLGVDAIRDLAVVSICCGTFTTLEFGDAAGLEVGDEIVAIGYALGLSGEATVTRGIVSAVRYDSEFQAYVIQTDAAINPGNSGGPMLSMSGQILGVNTFGYDETQSGRPVEGLNFAISGVTVQQQIPRLRAGTVEPTATPTSGVTMATRSFQSDTATPGSRVSVTITARHYGITGRIVERVPAGFVYDSSTLPSSAVTVSGRTVSFILLDEEEFSYVVIAPNAGGTYTFNGVLTDFDLQDYAIGGSSRVTVGTGGAEPTPTPGQETTLAPRTESCVTTHLITS